MKNLWIPVVVILFVATTIAVYLLPINKSQKAETQSHTHSDVGFEGYSQILIAALPKAQQQVLAHLDATANNDSLAAFWDALQQPGMAAYYFEKKAEANKTERNHIDAAFRYFDAFKTAQDTTLRQYFVEKAMSNYEAVLTINPKNLNAKTDLGLCYAEGSNEPMKGIMLLREVVTENPKHENAQLNLGFLSLKSNQIAKAIERFQTVLEINPARTDVYIYITQAYLQQGDSAEAGKQLHLFIEKSTDPKAKLAAKGYLKELGLP